MFAGKIDSALGRNDMLVDARELARLVESKSTATPTIRIPSPTSPPEDHIAMLELGMNLRYLLDHQILPLRGRHSAESAGVLPPGVAGEEDAWLVGNRRITRLGSIRIERIVGGVDDRPADQIGSAGAAVNAVILFPEPVLRPKRNLCAGIITELDDRALLLI